MGTQSNSWKKTFTKVLLFALILAIGGFSIYFYVPYSSSSVKAGQLNYIMYKGIIFKTYEGKLILTGIKTSTGGGIQSNQFEFSIDNKELALKLMNVVGQNVKLHYKEYYGALPWRGYTKYIVDSIVSIDPTPPATLTEIDPSIL